MRRTTSRTCWGYQSESGGVEIAIEGIDGARDGRPSSSRVSEMNCSTCGQRIPEPRPLRDASPDDHKAARAVRAVLNELVGQGPRASGSWSSWRGGSRKRLGYRAGVARGMGERVVAYVLG